MLKESRYVRLAKTMYRILKNSRIPIFLHRKSNHVFTVWQHIVLLTIRQYESKSYLKWRHIIPIESSGSKKNRRRRKRKVYLRAGLTFLFRFCFYCNRSSANLNSAISFSTVMQNKKISFNFCELHKISFFRW